MLRRTPWAAAAAGGILLLAAVASRATTLKPAPLSRAAARAAAVVVARVDSASPRRALGATGRPRIFTDYDLRDLRVLRGSVETENLVLSVVGGRMGDRVLRVEGAPRLEVGSRYVLLLDPRDRLCGLAGWGRGVFRVVESAGRPDRVATLEGLPVSAVEDGRVVTGGAAMDLEPFLSEVTSLRDAAPAPREGADPGRAGVRREAGR